MRTCKHGHLMTPENTKACGSCRQCARDQSKRWRSDNPDKARSKRGRNGLAAHSAVQHAVRKGSIVKPHGCEVCGKTARLNGHHDDYRNPLVVRWVCHMCHAAIHAMGQPLSGEKIRCGADLRDQRFAGRQCQREAKYDHDETGLPTRCGWHAEKPWRSTNEKQ